MKDEAVLVIDVASINQFGTFQGVSFDQHGYFDKVFSSDNLTFMNRREAEANYGFKQIIPYTLLKYNNTYLHYVRGKETAESRLVLQGSVGIGGHVSQVHDLKKNTISLLAAYNAAVKREIREEINIKSHIINNKIIAAINDDSNDVGRVHFGFVHMLELDGTYLSSNDNTITQISFRTIDELKNIRSSLETWSQLCIDFIIPRLESVM